MRLDGTRIAAALVVGLALLTWPAVRPADSAGSGFNEHIVVSQLNLWYYGPGFWGGFEAWDGSGRRNTPLTPWLGETYYSSDPRVVRQQINWAADYGVDAFSIEWTTPRGIDGSLEVNLDDAFLQADNLSRIKWCIFHDFNLRIDQTPGLEVDISQGVDFDDPAVAQLFIDDFIHFARKYFGHPQYLRINDRPVVYVWATNNFIGDLAGTIRTARRLVAEEGYDVYIVGEEIRDDMFPAEHAALFDAHTNFTFLVCGQDWTQWADVGDAAQALDGVLQRWSENTANLLVDGRGQRVNLQPGWAPQYDDRLHRENGGGGNPIWVLANSKEQVKAMAETARRHAQPLEGSGPKTDLAKHLELLGRDNDPGTHRGHRSQVSGRQLSVRYVGGGPGGVRPGDFRGITMLHHS